MTEDQLIAKLMAEIYSMVPAGSKLIIDDNLPSLWTASIRLPGLAWAIESPGWSSGLSTALGVLAQILRAARWTR